MSQHQPQTFTAFEGQQRLVSGPLPEVALAVKRAEQRAAETIAIFSDATGRAIDLDLRGSDDEIVARLPHSGPRHRRKHRANRAGAAGRNSAWSRAK